MKIWLNNGLYTAKPFFVFSTTVTIALSLALVLVPQIANAGLLSFISELMSNEAEAGTNGPVVNSQNMALLQATRNPNFNAVKGGGDITVIASSALLSEAGPSGTLADIEETKSNEISVYVVHSGDTLSGIAKMFGVSINTIIWSNDIRGSIQVGQKLVILPISGIRHAVVKGETIQSIAKKYKGDVEEIMQFNGLTKSSVLAIGDEVIIPDGEITASNVAVSSVSRSRNTKGPNFDSYYARPLVGGRKTQGLHGYNGVDLAAPTGTPVMASAAGQVIISRSSGWNGGYGEYIVIAHGNGTQTLYSHLSTNVAYEGSYVVQGQIIGYVGSTGKSTGPHLHFEVRGAQNPFR